jgi:nitronate monooxygenase
MTDLLQRLGLKVPIIQAPMAGTSTPALAAAVSNAGGLGSIAVGASEARYARGAIEALAAATPRAFNVNVFCHAPPHEDVERQRAWLAALQPSFATFGANPPARLRPIYKSFLEDAAMLQTLVEARPPLVSFHFGLPGGEVLVRLRAAGCLLMATATNVDEALAAEQAGVDAIVAQGYEAGGHRGVFDPDAPDDRLGTFALTRILVRRLNTPVIAAGGIMDGAGIAAALTLGATAAQLGTAFIGCPESAADDAYRAALFGPASGHTIMTRAVSGRPARCLSNKITALGEALDIAPPDYPTAYDAGKALNAAAKAHGESGYGAQWAGQGAPLARALPAAELMRVLREELEQAA